MTSGLTIFFLVCILRILGLKKIFKSCKRKKDYIPQHIIDYHIRTSGRIPDILRRKLDAQQALIVSSAVFKVLSISTNRLNCIEEAHNSLVLKLSISAKAV